MSEIKWIRNYYEDGQAGNITLVDANNQDLARKWINETELTSELRKKLNEHGISINLESKGGYIQIYPTMLERVSRTAPLCRRNGDVICENYKAKAYLPKNFSNINDEYQKCLEEIYNN
ncbi:MAG: hypothetical protein HFJ42_00230 [Clostridia bacterium]|nr:hypothetical protein [Clostridia bacterium]